MWPLNVLFVFLETRDAAFFFLKQETCLQLITENNNKMPWPEDCTVMPQPFRERIVISSSSSLLQQRPTWRPASGGRGWRPGAEQPNAEAREGNSSCLSVGCDINTLRWLTLRLIHLLILLPGKVLWGVTADGLEKWWCDWVWRTEKLVY